MIPDLRKYTKTSPQRMAAMARACERIDLDRIAGDIVECGVWRGGNVILARMLCPMRLCWLFDTFDGMTPPGPNDDAKAHYKFDSKTRAGAIKWARVPLDEVRGYFAETGTLDEGRLRFIVGPVEQTLSDPQNIPDRVAILRLDMDWHAPTAAALAALYERLEPGGFLIVDDYEMFQGCRRAVDQYFADRHFVPDKIDDGSGAIIWRRP